METRDCELFLNLAETLNFRKSAAQGGLSPSALSRVIQKLEQEVGKPLFIRNNRAVQLSPYGKRLVPFAREMLDQWSSLYQSFQSEENLSGELELYASVTACYSLLPPLLSRFKRKYPAIHLRLHTGDASSAMDHVLNGKTDLSIAARPGKQLPRNTEFMPLTETPLQLVIPRNMEIRSRWYTCPLVLAEKGEARNLVDKWFRDNGKEPDIYARVSGNEAILALVSLGFGAAILPELVIQQSSLKEKIRLAPRQPDFPAYQVGLCCKTARLDNPLVKAFWESVKESVRES